MALFYHPVSIDETVARSIRRLTSPSPWADLDLTTARVARAPVFVPSNDTCFVQAKCEEEKRDDNHVIVIERRLYMATSLLSSPFPAFLSLICERVRIGICGRRDSSGDSESEIMRGTSASGRRLGLMIASQFRPVALNPLAPGRPGERDALFIVYLARERSTRGVCRFPNNDPSRDILSE